MTDQSSQFWLMLGSKQIRRNSLIQCYMIGVFHNSNPLNLDSSDQQIRVCCDLNLNLDYESIDLPREVDQRIQIAWITNKSFKNNGGNMWQEILTFGKFLLY